MTSKKPYRKQNSPPLSEVCSLAVSRAGAVRWRNLLVNGRVVFLSESKHILLIVAKEKAQGGKLKPHQRYPSFNLTNL